MSHWPITRLGDLVSVKHGWPFKSEYFSEELTGQPIVVGIGNFQYSGGFRFESTTLKEYRDSYPPEYDLSPGDVLLVMTCQTAGGEILGIPGRIPADGRRYLHNQRLGKIVLRRNAPVSLDFIYWLFLSRNFNQHLFQTASGTKILHTSPGRIEEYCFALPSVPEQSAIAEMLSALDDKIDLNRRMNQTLEHMAQALFRSWFVDFDPVRAKAEGRQPQGMDAETAALFPSRFVESELGEIPEDWNVARLADLIELEKGVSYKGEFLSEQGAPMVNLKCIKAGGGFNREGLKNYSGPVKDRHRVAGGEIVLANTDLTQAREVLGAPGRVPRSIGCDAIFSHHIFAIRARPASRYGPNFLYQFLLTDSYRERASGFATGTTVLALPKEAVLQALIVAPPASLLSRFEEFAQPLHDRIECNEEENHTLAELRDTLLPKLLSGEIRVKDAEAAVAAAA
jgi:type I restriction enzyme S subunit